MGLPCHLHICTSVTTSPTTGSFVVTSSERFSQNVSLLVILAFVCLSFWSETLFWSLRDFYSHPHTHFIILLRLLSVWSLRFNRHAFDRCTSMLWDFWGTKSLKMNPKNYFFFKQNIHQCRMKKCRNEVISLTSNEWKQGLFASRFK